MIGWSLDNVTTAPPGGAGPVSVIVPVEEFPPATAEGLIRKVERIAGRTVNVAVCVTRYVAEMFAVAGAPAAMVTIEKFAVVAPAGTLTVAGTVATMLSL